MIPFIPYPKVVDTLSAWAVTEAERRHLDKAVWVASEKVHGANLCICTNGVEVTVAKRRALLEPSDPFFAYRRAIGPIVANVRQLFRALAETEWAFIYGELFGGHYPHADVTAIDGVQAVQTGVHYCPDVKFCAFDLATVDKDGHETFVASAEAMQRFDSVGLLVAPVLAKGTLNELLELPVTFQTHVPQMFGLPTLAQNWAEGMVIKPWNMGTVLGASRPVLKRKHDAFAETQYHQSRKWAGPTPADALGHAEAALLAMLNNNRLDSAITKIGRPNPNNAVALVAEVIRDLRDELDTHHGALVLSLTAEEAAVLWSVMHDEVTELVDARLDKNQPIDPKRYYAKLAWAFLRGRLPEAGTGDALVAAARNAEIRWNKFKRKSGPPRVMQVLSVLEGLQPTSLLDIGSGRGAFLWPLVARFDELEVTAVDRLPHRVRDIDAVHTGGITRVHGECADVTALPFDDDSFDIVTVLEVLEHLEDPAAAAAEVLRVSSRFVVASVPSHEDNNPQHIRLFTKDSLTALFEQAGAERVQISYVLNHMIAVIS